MPQVTSFNYSERKSLMCGDKMGLLKIAWTEVNGHFHCWLDNKIGPSMQREMKKRFIFHTSFDHNPIQFSFDLVPEEK
jgi:hypothetical protein